MPKQIILSLVCACEDEPELSGALAFARYAGLRVPSEICDLKFSDFTFDEFGKKGIFKVPITGKTGTRTVPFFSELQPYFLMLYNARQPDQEFVFAKYRKRSINTLARKKVLKKGLPVWVKFFVNLRSSCITDKSRLGWNRSLMDAVLGNSESIRLGHYIQPLPDYEYSMLGQFPQKSDNQPKQLGYGVNNNAIQVDTLAELMRLSADMRVRYGDKMFDFFELFSKLCEEVSEDEVKIAREALSIKTEYEIMELFPALVTENVTLMAKLLPKIIEKYPQDVQPFLTKTLANMPNIDELMTAAKNAISNTYDTKDLLHKFFNFENVDIKKSSLSVKNTLQQGGNWYNEIGRNYNEISSLTEYQLKKIKLVFKKKEIFFQKNHAYEKNT
ncbi:MAG: site-specific integrase [Planctomycetaceae bacterium]|jgi:hypothetical protein|nr:site-specific integrase [Planctomycetaceae bacterium]